MTSRSPSPSNGDEITTPGVAWREMVRWRDGEAARDRDALSVEEPLEIRIGDEPLAVTMRTPGDDQALAAGFCLTEGVIAEADELERVEPCAAAEFGNVIAVHLAEEALARRAKQIACARRELYLSSSCGLCGKQSIDRIRQTIAPIVGQFTVSTDAILAMPEAMRQAQARFEHTGGLHAAGLFTIDGQLKALHEDVGRHNAVDKVIGWALLNGLVPIDPSRVAAAPGVLMVSGRASFEIVQKAAVAGIAVIAAVSAPSSLAVDLAEEAGVTLIGFLRPGRMNIYTHARRVDGAAA